MPSTPRNDDFHVAIICALGVESEAVEGLFDQEFDSNDLIWKKADGDRNSYTTGVIGRHNVVLAYMPGMGKINAATTASYLSATFQKIKLALVVGICGGAPRDPNRDGKEIFLGDVIISTQIRQGDFGRELVDGFVMKTIEEGNLGLASSSIRSFLHKLQSRSIRTSIQTRCAGFAKTIQEYLELESPRAQGDVLFSADYIHKHRSITSGIFCEICSQNDTAYCSRSQKLSCSQLGCSAEHNRRTRTRDVAEGPQIFFGSVLSTDAVKRNGFSRDDVTMKHDVIAFEMEGAGVWEVLPTMIIKGVCDYADSHKNKSWQAYSAVTAAGCCKAVLEEWAPVSQDTAPNSASIHNQDKERAELRKKYLTSLNFDELDSRQQDIQFAHPGTYDWIFQSAEFISWLNEDDQRMHHGVLWIKGKPGSGKSTMMKHIHQFVQSHFAVQPVMAHFFHARGHDLQKNLLGLLRSLVLQLLQGNTELLDHFTTAFPALSSKPVEAREWTKEQLRHFLSLATRQKWYEEAVILIDALDECDHHGARQLVQFCEDLAWTSTSSSLRLLICLSSRHYPHIGMKNCIELHLDDRTEHDADIELWIRQKIRILDDALIEKVVKKAQHVFLWAVLTVEILNETYDNGGGLQAMHNQLNDVPSDLHAIFDARLFAGDTLDEATILMFRLVLYAFEPLHPHSLYLLIADSNCHGNSSLWSDGDMADERIQKLILNTSRGMLEIIDASSMKSAGKIVQFIHESVADFLRSKSTANRLFSFEPICHRSISIACMECLSANRSPQSSLESLSSRHLLYALRYTLRHIDKAAGSSDLLEIVSRYIDEMSVFHLWLANNLLISSQYLQDEAVVFMYIMNTWQYPDSVHGHTLDIRLLQSVFDSPKVKAVLLSGTRETVMDYALRCAIGKFWLEAIELLLVTNSTVAYTMKCCRHIFDMMEWIHAENLTQAKTIIAAIVSKTVARLRTASKRYTFSTESDKQLLNTTLRYGVYDFFSVLLEIGADPNVCDIQGNTALFLLLRSQHICFTEARAKHVGLLLEHGADSEKRDGQGRSILHLAIELGYTDVVNILLQHNVDIHGNGSGHCYPVHLAVQYGRLGILRRLLGLGVSPDRQCENGRTALHHATAERRDLKAIQMLLPKSHLDTTDWDGNTPLHLAVMTGYIDAARLLIEHGSHAKIENKSGRDALDLANLCEDFDMREELIDLLSQTRSQKLSIRVLDLLN